MKTDIQEIFASYEDQNCVYFPISKKTGKEYDRLKTYFLDGEIELYGLPIKAESEVTGTKRNPIDAAIDGDFTGLLKIGIIRGTLILGRLLYFAGEDILDAADEHSEELQYVVSSLFDDGGPMNEETGDPALDVYCIHEIEIDTKIVKSNVKSRVLKEIPFLVREFYHVLPDLLTYHPAPVNDKWISASMREENELLQTIAQEQAELNINAALGRLPEIIEKQPKNVHNVFMHHDFTDDEIHKVMGMRNSSSEYPEEFKDLKVVSFYKRNGFKELTGSRLMVKII